MAKLLRLGAVIIAVISTRMGVATEIDNFVPHLVQMKDSLPQLNALTNYRLKQARDWANSRSSCVDRDMRAGVWEYLAGHLWGRLENDIERMEIFHKVAPTLSQSIYEYLSPLESLSAFDIVKLGGVIRLGDYRIGSDKFGHFFAEGNKLFNAAFLQGKGFDAAMDYTELTERGIFGVMTTAVYAYADAVANFNGMIFWSKLTPQFADKSPFGGEPYFTCQNKRWQQTRVFRWEELIDGAWDESINCSAYRTKAIHEKVALKISQLEKAYQEKTGKKVNLHCPVFPYECYKAALKYKQFTPRLLHRTCYGVARDIHNANDKK